MHRSRSFVPNTSCGPCLYCNQVSVRKPEEFLRCNLCRRSVHISCLHTGIPHQKLDGDNFFEFTCAHCGPRNCEQVARAKLSNLHLVLLSMYNMNLKSGSDDLQFFHYKIDIHRFIIRHHSELFSYKGSSVYRGKKQIRPATLTSSMNENSRVFIPQQKQLRKGLYRLVELASPAFLLQKYMPERCNLASRPSNRCDMLDADDEQDIEFSEVIGEPTKRSERQENTGVSLLPDEEFCKAQDPNSNLNTPSANSAIPVLIEEIEIKLESEPEMETEENEPAAFLPCLKQSLFSPSSPPPQQLPPQTQEFKENIIPLSVYEERQLLDVIESSGHLSADLRRLRRKLKLRRLHREHNEPVFNLSAELDFLKARDRLMTKWERKASQGGTDPIDCRERVLDRYQVHGNSATIKREFGSFRDRLTGSRSGSRSLIHSPYSLRRFEPYIFRDFSTIPLKVKLLQEIRFRAEARKTASAAKSQKYSRKPIDYCYVTPKFIPAMNYLARQFFWPGIELSEALNYPEFTCVALYGQLVVGFGLVVPDARFDEAYLSFLLVHPEWRRAGIAKVILYHLIQACKGKDITLHVSATNPALILYQSFGFKVEEFLSNFYDKYLPADSEVCKHAMFLRLRR